MVEDIIGATVLGIQDLVGGVLETKSSESDESDGPEDSSEIDQEMDLET